MTELSAPASTGAYASGFTSLDTEIDVGDLPVQGTIPDWLRGTLIRNGPAHYEAGPQSFRHWFDGQAMLHRFTVADGQVSYSNRFLRTPSSQIAREEGRIGFREFATDPCRSIFARFFTSLEDTFTANANVNVVPMNGGYAALTEVPIAVQFDPDTLETVGVTDYHDHLNGPITSPHPHQQPGTNDLINYVLHFGRRSHYRIYRQRPGSMTRQLVAAVPTQHPSYMHSFAVTEDYAVLVTFPLVVNPLSLLLSSKPFIENYRWRPELGTQFIVVDLHDGTVRGTATGEAVFAFHHINAYQDGDQIVVDLCAFPDASIIDAFYLDRLRHPDTHPDLPLARPTRYRIDPQAGTVHAHKLSDQTMELPQINYRVHNGHPYRYAYGTSSHDRRSDDFLNQLTKLDVHTGATRTWHEPRHLPRRTNLRPRSPAWQRGRRRDPLRHARHHQEAVIPARARRGHLHRTRPRRGPARHPVRIPRPLHHQPSHRNHPPTPTSLNQPRLTATTPSDRPLPATPAGPSTASEQIGHPSRAIPFPLQLV